MQASSVLHGGNQTLWCFVIAVGLLLVVWAVLCCNILFKANDGLYLSSTDDDALVEYWMCWWANKALFSDQYTLFRCPLINYPTGAVVFSFSPSYYHIVFSGLIRDLAGPTGAINLTFAAVLLFSIFCTWLFLTRLTSSPVFAGLLSCLPAIYLTLDPRGYLDLERADYGLLCLALWLWLDLIEKGGWKRGVLAGLAVGLTTSALLYYGVCVSAILALGAIAPRIGIRPLKKIHRQTSLLTILALGISVLFTLLVHWRALHFFYQYGPYQERILAAIESYVSPLTLLILLIPALLALGCRKVDSTILFWFFATTLLLLLAIDPFLSINGVRYNFLTPFMGIKRFVPFFWRLNSPHRFGWMAIIPLIAVLARAGDCLSTRLPRNPQKILGLTAVLFLLGNAMSALMSGHTQHTNFLSLILPPAKPIPVEPLPPVPISILEKIRNEKEPSVVFDLAGQKQQWIAYLQTYHQQPIVGNGVVPTQFTNQSSQTELSGYLHSVRDSLHQSYDIALPDKEWFRRHYVRYAILYLDSYETAKIAWRWEKAYGSPIYVEQGFRIFDLTGQ